jgi:hypothetical protein
MRIKTVQHPLFRLRHDATHRQPWPPRARRKVGDFCGDWLCTVTRGYAVCNGLPVVDHQLKQSLSLHVERLIIARGSVGNHTGNTWQTA